MQVTAIYYSFSRLLWAHNLLESILDTGEGRHKYVRRITLLRTIQRHCARPCRPVRRHARRVYKNRNYGTDIYGIMGTDSTYSNSDTRHRWRHHWRPRMSLAISLATRGIAGNIAGDLAGYGRHRWQPCWRQKASLATSLATRSIAGNLTMVTTTVAGITTGNPASH